MRPFAPGDRPAVRALVCATAFRNLGAAAVFEDVELLADYWTRYYTDFEPGSCLVVEEEGRVVACLLGCVDTRRLIRVSASRIVPPLVALAVTRLALGRYRRPETKAMLRWALTASWREAPPVDLRRYPAHYHCNVLPPGYRKGYYTRLALTFLDHLDARGVRGLHGQIEEPAARGTWSRSIRRAEEATRLAEERAGIRVSRTLYLAERPSTLHQAVLGRGEPMVNRAWAASVGDFRLWLGYLAARFGM